jgi:hypothetical protein
MTEKATLPIEQVERRFNFNVKRVDELVSLFGKNKDKESYPKDVLRAAIVLLHASLEDLLREMIRIRATEDPSALLDDLQFPNPRDSSKSVEKIKVAELVTSDERVWMN